MPKELQCLRCGVPMRYARREKLQLGQTGWLLGDLPNLLAGAMDTDIYCCPQCGKIELFQADMQEQAGDHIAQRQCPRCGKRHDMDFPKCPFCRYDYRAE